MSLSRRSVIKATAALGGFGALLPATAHQAPPIEAKKAHAPKAVSMESDE